MHKVWFLFVLICFSQFVLAQPVLERCETEYLKKLGDKTDTDSLRLRLGYFQCLLTADPELSRTELAAFLAKPTVKNNPVVFADANIFLGVVSVNQARFDEALQLFNEVFEWAQRSDDAYRMSLARMNAGIIHRKRSAFGSSMEAYVQALQYARASKQQPLIATILQNMGSLANSTEQFALALEYSRESLTLHKNSKNERGSAGAMANMGISLKLMGKTDSAILLYNEAAGVFEKLNDRVNQAKMHSNIGQLYLATRAYDKALRSLNLAIDMMEEQGNYNDLVNTLNAKTQLLIKKEEFFAAVQTAKRSILLAEKQGYLMGAKNAYDYLAEAQAGSDQLKEALGSYRQMQKFTDSIRQKEQDSLLLSMRLQFESEKKDLEIASKDRLLALQREKIHYTYIIASLLGALVLLLLLLIWRRQRFNRKLAEQHRLLELQHAELTQLVAFKDRMLTIVSHDVRNPLAGLKSMLALQSSGAISQEEFTEWNSEVTQRIDSALSMLHNLLEWSKLEYVGLKPYKERIDLNLFMREVMEQVQYQASFKSVYLKWETEPGLCITADRHMLRTCLYNLVSNAIKYSHKGDSVFVLAKASRMGTQLEVKDKGVGMDEKKLEALRSPNVNFTTYGTENEKGSGVGLVLVKELLQLMDSSLEIESEAGKGSVFRFVLPD